jgi:type II secretory pathway component GspD/PulD (secretin)
MPCTGSESGEDLVTFSLDANQEALGEVLQKISKATGYEIVIEPQHAQLPITVSLKEVTVHEALRRIFGRLSKYMIINDIEKKISLNIVDADGKKIGAGERSDQSAVVGKETDPMDAEVVPPDEPGGRSFTQREVEELRARQVKIDPMDIEEVPPANPGEKSFTLREIEAIRSKQKETMPKQIEEIPPDNM